MLFDFTNVNGIPNVQVTKENIEEELFKKFDAYWDGKTDDNIFKVTYEKNIFYVLTIAKLKELLPT